MQFDEIHMEQFIYILIFKRQSIVLSVELITLHTLSPGTSGMFAVAQTFYEIYIH